MNEKSNVTIICEQKAYELFRDALKMVDAKPDLVQKNEDHYILKWNSIRWYTSNDDIFLLEKTMTILDEKTINPSSKIEPGYSYHKFDITEDREIDERCNNWQSPIGYYKVMCEVVLPSTLETIDFNAPTLEADEPELD